MTSFTWTTFEKPAHGKNTANCNFCHEDVEMSEGTLFELLRHATTKHCDQYSDFDFFRRDEAEEVEAAKKRNSVWGNDDYEETLDEEATFFLAMALRSTGVNVNLCDDPNFREFALSLNLYFKTPTAEEVKKLIEKIDEDEKKKNGGSD